MGKMFLAFGIAFLITVGMAPKLIPYLRKLKFGQQILEIGPAWHKNKQGTPTMGGIMFIIATVVCMLIFTRDTRSYVCLIMPVFFGLIGWIDDYTKVAKKRNLGLRAMQKIFLQVLVSITFLISLKVSGLLETQVLIPFWNEKIEFGYWFYPFAIFIILGTVNSVNLTDGIDGLAACVTIPVCVFFGAVSIIFMSYGLGILASSVAGGLAGFLIFNFHPAKIFMGDTGSLFLGGVVCALAFGLNMPVILVIVGFIYLLEALSDIIQVFYYKATKKRFFKMAPLHHHFEKCGWSEEKIVYVFSGTTVILCIVAFMSVMQYYFM